METPVATRIRGIYNLLVMRKIDDFMKNKFMRQWYDFKNKTAIKRGDRTIPVVYY